MICGLCDKKLDRNRPVWICRFCGRGGLCSVCMKTHYCDRKIAGIVRDNIR